MKGRDIIEGFLIIPDNEDNAASSDIEQADSDNGQTASDSDLILPPGLRFDATLLGQNIPPFQIGESLDELDVPLDDNNDIHPVQQESSVADFFRR